MRSRKSQTPSRIHFCKLVKEAIDDEMKGFKDYGILRDAYFDYSMKRRDGDTATYETIDGIRMDEFRHHTILTEIYEDLCK